MTRESVTFITSFITGLVIAQLQIETGNGLALRKHKAGTQKIAIVDPVTHVTPGDFGWAIFKLIKESDGCGISHEIVPRWFSRGLTDTTRNIGSVNDLLQAGNQLLSKPALARVSVAILR